MLTSMRIFIKGKGQGLTEYVLIFAFIAMIAYAMIEGETGLKSTVSNTFSDSRSKIGDAASNMQ